MGIEGNGERDYFLLGGEGRIWGASASAAYSPLTLTRKCGVYYYIDQLFLDFVGNKTPLEPPIVVRVPKPRKILMIDCMITSQLSGCRHGTALRMTTLARDGKHEHSLIECFCAKVVYRHHKPGAVLTPTRTAAVAMVVAAHHRVLAITAQQK